MKKTTVLWIILDLVFIIVFNTIFFIAGGFHHQFYVWLSYGFIHFSYIMLLLTPLFIRRGKSAALYGFSLYSISSIYFLIEFIIGIAFILFSTEIYKLIYSKIIESNRAYSTLSVVYKIYLTLTNSNGISEINGLLNNNELIINQKNIDMAALIVQPIVAGLYVILLVANMIANEHTAEAEEERQPQIAYIKNASEKLKNILERVDDKETKRKIERVYDAVYSSPVKSHPDLAQMECNILFSINELDNTVSARNKESIISLTDSLLAAINERNSRLRILN